MNYLQLNIGIFGNRLKILKNPKKIVADQTTSEKNLTLIIFALPT